MFRSRLLTALAAVAILLGLAWWNPSFLRPVQFALGTLARPFQEMTAYVAFRLREAGTFFRDIGQLKEENARLLTENRRLRGDQARLTELEEENRELREALRLLPREEFALTGADVIGRDSDGGGQWLLVNRGTRHGVRPGQAVLAEGRTLLGRVESSALLSSRVMLLTHPESVVNVSDPATGAKGVVRGEYGLGLLLDMVLQADRIDVGDEILTSNLGGSLPAGLLVGSVSETRDSSDRLFRQATLLPAVAPDSLRTVFIIVDDAP